MRFPASLPVLFVLPLIASAQPQHIAPTDPKSPEDERKTFRLPPGFEAQLVASEPAIQKPMQIAFDAKGRLWVTTSHHYPFPADDAKASDRLYVLSDFAPDGRAKSVTVFAENLNIPIGVLPLPDGKSCIVSSVGRILKLTDADGDGKADRTEVLFRGFGTKDTHGMTNSFTLMPDGWVYACHGFANESVVRGADGHEVRMQSGHTFRFRPDGSRIEVYTRGQVNPFGMTADPWGNLYTADCHSKPITQLIRGAYYDSFGKPHDGLGYAPHVTHHDHGSTALCGLAWYDADHYPAAYRGCMFLGNVVTNRINFDRIEWKGSTPVAVEQPDFLASGDPWFRPTDIKLGPDGALYVSDFYNRIIGHYEVDLKHPGRDKDRGRVWRIVYAGGQSETGERPGLSRPSDDARAARRRVDGMTERPSASNIATLLELLPTVPAEDTHLRHAARIALRNALACDEAQPKLVWMLQTDVASKGPRSAALDDVFLGVPSAYAGWWFSKRMKAGTLDPAVAARAAEHLARYGCDCHRRVAWAAANEVADTPTQLALLTAMRRGLQAAGATFRTDPAAKVRQKVEDGLRSADDRVARQSLQLAAAVDLNASLSAFDLLRAKGRSEALRTAALAYLIARGPADGLVPTCGELARDPATPPALRDQAAGVFAGSKADRDRAAARDLLKEVPYRTAATIAVGLAGSRSGADLLFAAVKAGQASPRLLQEPLVLARLKAAGVPNLDARVKELTAGIPSADARLVALVKQRGDGYRAAKPDPAKGKVLFTNNCAACHQIGGQGGKVGPNLDGVGNRGADRLCEDVLDPSRNVDAAFRTTRLDLSDGRALSGLLLRQEGKVLVMADAQGKEVRVPEGEVDKRSLSAASPMPADFGERLKPDEFYHLLAYLLEQRAK
jgi:putative heme-binding domain-containing protein